jgi:hypothetical protein
MNANYHIMGMENGWSVRDDSCGPPTGSIPLHPTFSADLEGAFQIIRDHREKHPPPETS